MAKERWLPVTGFEGVYEVSDFGRVRSLSRIAMRSNGYPQTILGKIRCTPLAMGYPSLQLKHNGKMKNAYVHHLVAEAFIGRRPPGKEVAHGDGDKRNCRLKNLRYATPVENDADKIRHGTRSKGEVNGHAILTASAVLAIRQRVAAGELQRDVALDYGIRSGHVCCIVHRKIWKHL